MTVRVMAVASVPPPPAYVEAAPVCSLIFLQPIWRMRLPGLWCCSNTRHTRKELSNTRAPDCRTCQARLSFPEWHFHPART